MKKTNPWEKTVKAKDAEIINICNFLITELMSLTESAASNNDIDKRKMRILVTPQLRVLLARYSGYPVNYPMKINGVEIKTITEKSLQWYVAIAGEHLHLGGKDEDNA